MHIMILDNGTLPVEDPKRKWTKLHQLLSSSLYKKNNLYTPPRVTAQQKHYPPSLLMQPMIHMMTFGRQMWTAVCSTWELYYQISCQWSNQEFDPSPICRYPSSDDKIALGICIQDPSFSQPARQEETAINTISKQGMEGYMKVVWYPREIGGYHNRANHLS